MILLSVVSTSGLESSAALEEADGARRFFACSAGRHLCRRARDCEMRTCTCACTCTHVHVRAHTYMHIHTCVCTFAYIPCAWSIAPLAGVLPRQVSDVLRGDDGLGSIVRIASHKSRRLDRALHVSPRDLEPAWGGFACTAPSCRVNLTAERETSARLPLD